MAGKIDVTGPKPDAGQASPDGPAQADGPTPDAAPDVSPPVDAPAIDIGPADATAPEASTPDMGAVDVAATDAPAPDVSPDVPPPDGPAPDAPAPDAPVPDAPLPDSPAPDAPTGPCAEIDNMTLYEGPAQPAACDTAYRYDQFVRRGFLSGQPAFLLGPAPDGAQDRFGFVGVNAYQLYDDSYMHAQACTGAGCNFTNAFCESCLTCTSCGSCPPCTSAQCEACQVDEVLREARDMELRVVRTWAFHDDPAQAPRDLQDGPPADIDSDGQADLMLDPVGLKALDWVVWRAKRQGLKLILPLANYNRAYGGIQQYLAWHGVAGGDPDAVPSDVRACFFTHPTMRAHYKAYIKSILWRRNQFICEDDTDAPCAAGVQNRLYRDEPTIMAWEMLNEPRGNGLEWTGGEMFAWVDEMSTYIKAPAPAGLGDCHHLVATGESGFEPEADPITGEDPMYQYCCDASCTPALPAVAQLYPNMCARDSDEAAYCSQASPNWDRTLERALYDPGSSYCRNTSAPNVDFGTLHFYLENEGICGSPDDFGQDVGLALIADHRELARRAGKPFVVGEFALRSSECPGTTPTAPDCEYPSSSASGCLNRNQRRNVYDTWFRSGCDGMVDGMIPWVFAGDRRSDGPHNFYCCSGELAACLPASLACPEGSESPRYADIIECYAQRFNARDTVCPNPGCP